MGRRRPMTDETRECPSCRTLGYTCFIHDRPMPAEAAIARLERERDELQERANSNYEHWQGWEGRARLEIAARERADAALAAERERLQAEIDVINGKACAEEQARGDGPCGICRTCLRGRLTALQAERDRLREALFHYGSHKGGCYERAVMAGNPGGCGCGFSDWWLARGSDCSTETEE
jgi:hypothetical protein